MITNEDVIRIAKEYGFDLTGFAKAEPLNIESEFLSGWLVKGYNADMHYMLRNQEKRNDIRKIFQGTKSVISLGLNYYTPYIYSGNKKNGKISRYAWGTDYHTLIRGKLENMIQRLKDIDSSFEAVSYVDTGPVLDKAWGVKSGIGWQGKHSNIINKEIGSWFFIANIISNIEFIYDVPIEDYCGSCTACLDACPTNAIVEPYVVDSNKCISYQTIENKGDIPEGLKGKFEDWIFGCDICQDICPWNIKFSRVTSVPEFYDSQGKGEIPLDKILNMSQEEFSLLFKDSPVKRTKLKGLKRNAAFLNESV
jgi:epoxyqueuosine reductase